MKVIELAEPYAKSEIYPEQIVLALGFLMESIADIKP